MKQITLSSTNPSQLFNLPLSTGDLIYFKLTYRVRTQQWYVSLTYRTWVVNNIRLCSMPNVLEQFANIFGFGLMVQMSDDGEPFMITDFQTGRVTLYLLEASDIPLVAQLYAGTLT